MVYLNGEFIKAEDAKISIFDRGFLFADSVYEVIPVYKGNAYFIDRHLSRLQASLAAIKMTMPNLDFPSLFQELVTLNNSGDMQIYLQITRGTQNKRTHDIPNNLTPTVVLFTIHNSYPSFADKKKGLRAKLVEDNRWLRCNIKTTSMLANILLNDEAVVSGANTALLIRDGFLTEGSASNVFMVDKAGVIHTPPQTNLCLPGITRQLTIELITALHMPFKESMISKSNLLDAQEVWITSTTKEIYPITQLDDKPVGEGKGGKYWEILDNQYQNLIKTL
ncbi:D-amino acid aminotransferase [Legionella septentrionalis]|uniref:Aminodeoxychorismate lyase n=2 Tax=Legionella septentrionalis TaxID=2498109 RepID=A0A3S0V553_9GAMM|nr:D-amino acid aminotransferase [Legionella sp. 27cVA30]RUQ85214.1 D-amino acid aminotransferase [Legionella septentrionalis]MCP0913294.1 D-amino acid aminotransferase [Legionella sp. 27cVA30]RUQ98007.1 D-amino acid aminotransferase [Legionella septentrionalis]RUR08845.1 D-amino acid aminotransferase [Legionella septentrionalis]RUR14687.1 D-amino acid aminotransferase [Legionella septentrionalis]